MMVAVYRLRPEKIVPGVIQMFADDRIRFVGHVDLTGDQLDLFGGCRPVDNGEGLGRDEFVWDAKKIVERPVGPFGQDIP